MAPGATEQPRQARWNATTRRTKQGGFIAVAYAAMILGMVGFVGLAVDVGYMQYERRRLQAAADAAAMGALREMELGNTDLTTAGQNDSALNGFTNGQGNTTVTINNPPASGTYSGVSTAVQAIVQKRVPTFFMSVFGQSAVTLSAQAVAQTTTTYGSVGGCIFVLDPTASGAFSIVGNVTISSACGAVVNSNSSSAFSMTGSSSFTLNNGAVVGVVGPGTAGEGWSFSGGGKLVNGSTGQTEYPTNIQSFGDPLANVAAPTASGLTVQSTSTYSVKPNQTVTANPGIYCGGMDLKGTVTFNPGTYVLAGGGMTINAQANITGSNVTFYNTTGSFSASCGSSSAGSMTFNGGATINLAGSTSTGVLFFEDRNVTGLSHTINGNSSSTFDGALYFKNANLTFSGTNKTPGFLYIVVDTLSLKGNANLGNDHSDLTSVYTIAPTATGGGIVQ
jgi:Flp pilus assembly protein TadG